MKNEIVQKILNRIFIFLVYMTQIFFKNRSKDTKPTLKFHKNNKKVTIITKI
uniref:Uncharacterized protein n=1 Tax=viral metagenome TaxID=1070528 RepID=A0A6C0E981_9ZZZZ